MSERDDLLLLLKERYGQHADGRKVRSDTGKSHTLATTRKPRSDKGQKRGECKKTSQYYYRLFQAALSGSAIRNEVGEVVGEGATRDENGIFDLQITKRWKQVTRANGQSYKYRQNKKILLEEHRWNWLKKLHEEQPSDASMFIRHYHILPDEVDMWTFSEWAIAYMDESDGGCVLLPSYKIHYYDNNGKVKQYENKYKLFED